MKHYEQQQLLHCNFGWIGAARNGYYNSEMFTTNEGPVTRKDFDYIKDFRVLYDVVGYKCNIKM